MAHLLIADDIAISRETLARLLREAGHRVTAVASGQEAVDRARADGPDMAILDLGMPRVSGAQAAPLIKGAWPGQLLPVLIVSGRVLSGEELQELLTVADDFLRKPFVPAEICARVDVWLRTRRLFEEQRRGAGAQAPAPGAPPAGSSGAASAPPASALSAGTPPAALTEGGPGKLRPRAAFIERVEDEWRRAQRWNDPFALVLLAWREPAGAAQADVLWSVLGRTAGRALRQVDLLGQLGPARAGVLLPNTSPAGALSAAERLRADLRAAPSAPTELAMGLAIVPSRDVCSPEDLLAVAELALDRALSAGGWSLCLHQHQGYLVRSP